VTLAAVGTCTIQATQSGNTTWAAAAPVKGSFQVAAPCDVTGDSPASVADVQLMIDEALGVAPAVNDLNHDGAIDVSDVQRVINAVLQLGWGARLKSDVDWVAWVGRTPSGVPSGPADPLVGPFLW
jgi:hypothetical protein